MKFKRSSLFSAYDTGRGSPARRKRSARERPARRREQQTNKQQQQQQQRNHRDQRQRFLPSPVRNLLRVPDASHACGVAIGALLCTPSTRLPGHVPSPTHTQTHTPIPLDFKLRPEKCLSYSRGSEKVREKEGSLRALWCATPER